MAVDILVAAEREFASVAASQGMRAAFLQFLSDDSVLFRPVPVNGQEWFKAQPDTPGLLSWRPEFTELAASGDLGFTTGPWEYRNHNLGDPVQHGQYVSVWRREDRSVWKVVLDAGINCPPPTDRIQTTEVASVDHTGQVRPGVNDFELLQVEATLLTLISEEGCAEAVRRMGGPDLWVMRPDSRPQRGLKEMDKILPGSSIGVECQVEGAVAASSGDLGYVYGTGFRRSNDEPDRILERCSFLRIWRWGDQGRWELALDIENPVPLGTG